jgi:hypothetical protein
MKHLQRLALGHGGAPATDPAAALKGVTGDLAGSTARFDDTAMVVLKCLK